MRSVAAVLTLSLLAPSALAQDDGAPPAEAAADAAGDETIHQELRALKQTCEQAINAGEVETLLDHMHPDIVITWPTGEVSRGHDGVQAFYANLFTGPDAQLEQYQAEHTVEV